MTIYSDDGTFHEDAWDHEASFNERFPQEGMPISVDRSYQVPYISGMSNDNSTVYVDKSVPKEVTLSYKTFDPAVPLAIHEKTEKVMMDHLIKDEKMPAEKAYEIAHHGFAQPAEDNWYRQNGIDINEANKFWESIDRHTEREIKPTDTPPDLYIKPYPHGQITGTGKTDPESSFSVSESDQAQQAAEVAAQRVQRAGAPKGMLASDQEQRASNIASAGAAVGAMSPIGRIVGAVAGGLTLGGAVAGSSEAGEASGPQWWQRESAIKPEPYTPTAEEEKSYSPGEPPKEPTTHSLEDIAKLSKTRPQTALALTKADTEAMAAYNEQKSKYTATASKLAADRLQYIKDKNTESETKYNEAYQRDLKFKEENEGLFQKYPQAASYMEALSNVAGFGIGWKSITSVAGRLSDAVDKAREITGLTSSKATVKQIREAINKLEKHTGEYEDSWKQLGSKAKGIAGTAAEIGASALAPITAGAIIPAAYNRAVLPETSPYKHIPSLDNYTELLGTSFAEAVATHYLGHTFNSHIKDLKGLRENASVELTNLRQMQQDKANKPTRAAKTTNPDNDKRIEGLVEKSTAYALKDKNKRAGPLPVPETLHAPE